jgi:hypothetical protein
MSLPRNPSSRGYVRITAGSRHGPWIVLARIGKRGLFPLYAVRGACCGVLTARTTNALSHARIDGSQACPVCSNPRKGVPAAPASARVCRWCSRSTVRPGGRKGPVRECQACQRAACRNGRTPTGRPIARGVRRVMRSAS